VRQVPESTKEEVLRLWLSGLTYRAISAKTGLSLGVISKIIDECRQKTADIEELRKLSIALKQAKASVDDSLRAARFLGSLDESGFDSACLPVCLDFITEAGERARGLASAAGRLTELEKKAGKPYDKFLLEFEEKVKAEAEISKRAETLESAELRLRTSIRHLEKLKALQEMIDRTEITPPILETFINDGKRFQDLGFTLQRAEVIVRELSRRGLDPGSAAAQIGSLLREYSDLDDARQKAEAEARRLASEVKALESKAQSLRDEIARSEERLRRLEQDSQERREQLEKDYRALASRLKTERDAEQKKLEDGIVEFRQRIVSELQELQSTADSLRTDVKELESAKANISEAEKALQTIRAAVEKSRILASAVSLIENPAAPKSHEGVLEATLAVTQGPKSYLETSDFSRWKHKLDLKADVDRLFGRLVEELR